MIKLTGFEEEIQDLLKKYDNIGNVARKNQLSAAMYATELIETKEKNILSAKYPQMARYIKRKVKNMSKLKNAYEGSITTIYVDIGYTDADYRTHPELYVLEFGRPGRSVRTMQRRQQKQHGKLTHIGKDGKVKSRRARGSDLLGNVFIDSLGRKIGKLDPVGAVRQAWLEEKQDAAMRFCEHIIKKVQEEWGK